MDDTVLINFYQNVLLTDINSEPLILWFSTAAYLCIYITCTPSHYHGIPINAPPYKHCTLIMD